MDDTLKMVRDFHVAFEIDCPERPTTLQPKEAEPAEIASTASVLEALAEQLMEAAKEHNSTLLLRLQLCQEELAELARAMADQDEVGCLDALCDMRYVADGTVLALGMGGIFMPAMREVQRSNMSKLVDGRPMKNEAGRVLKPDTYSPPDLAVLLDERTCPACGETHDTRPIAEERGETVGHECNVCLAQWTRELS